MHLLLMHLQKQKKQKHLQTLKDHQISILKGKGLYI